MDALDTLLFIVLPYLALIIFFVGTIYRYWNWGFNVSSLSSEFLEGKKLFWGSVPFHWGLVVVFMGHLIAFLIPQGILAWNSHPVRLIILEVTAFIFGLSILFGLVGLMYRRFTNPRVKMVTTRMDVLVEVLLLAEVVLGLWTAYGFRWGSSWFASSLSPYLWSVLAFAPNAEAVSQLPWVIKLHIANAFLILLLIPFSRLMHIVVIPFQYILRPYQLVYWYWDRKEIRKPTGRMKKAKPRNN